MRRSRYISFILALLLLLTAVFPMTASASVDLSGKNITTVQKYFVRTIGSLARADYYQTDVLASVTLAQAIYESGWGRYSLPVGGHNLFGIKAFHTWDGKVYDQSTSTLYASYDDFLVSAGVSHVNSVSAWRAHENWAESVGVHSALFHEESKYAAVVGEKDYKTCAQAIVNAGYCGDYGYVDMVCNLIEQYGLTEYDNLTPDEDGIVAVTTAPEQKSLEIGETYTIPLTYYPSDKTPSSLTWKSDKPEVATVDQNGRVTAVAHGTTLVTATLKNGREAACIIHVDCNATVIDTDMTVYSSASKTSSSKGLVYQGTSIKVLEDKIYTDSNGYKFYKISAYKSTGALIEGYALTTNIYLNKRNVSLISVIKDNLTLKVNDKYTVKTVVAPSDAVDVKLTWTSSNTSVATVDQNGVITAKALGNAIINAKADGGAERKISLTVANAYREYDALVNAYDALTIRSQPNSSSTRVGTLPHLGNVKVIGEPNGTWFEVSGKASNGKTINGYASSSYIYIIKDGYTVTYGDAPENVTVYKDTSTTSTSYGKLLSGSKYAIVDTADGDWKHIIGVNANGNSVVGYAKIDTSSGENTGSGSGTGSGNENQNPEETETKYYGRTTSVLFVRSGAGTGYTAVGQLALGAQIIITGDAVNGWYKVSGTGFDGTKLSGYSSAEFIEVLYSGTVNATQLNVRETPVSGAVVHQFNKGDSVVIVGDAVDGWYSVETKDGAVKGYCSAEFITVDGVYEVPEGSEPQFSINNSQLTITNGILNGVTHKTKVADLLKSFSGTVEVTDASGNVLSGESFAGTGCKLRVTENSQSYYAATLLVKGDVSGDGKIDSQDYLLIKRHLMKNYQLKDVYYTAGLLSGENEMKVTDYILVKRVCFGTYTIK
ncbi:MAG: SH3 domain-containing protein [Clostridia bacterium]|nr:SH3 domain-containing protein [Clostridia bacterium]